MDSDQDKRRLAEEEIHDTKIRAAEKTNLAASTFWVLAGVLVLALIVTAVL